MGITLSELQPVTDLLRDQNFLWYNFAFERELIILFSYLFLASLLSLLTSRLAKVFSNYLHLDEFFEIVLINDFVILGPAHPRYVLVLLIQFATTVITRPCQTPVIKVTRKHHKPERSDFMFPDTVLKFSIKVVRILIKLEGGP